MAEGAVNIGPGDEAFSRHGGGEMQQFMVEQNAIASRKKKRVKIKILTFTSRISCALGNI